MSSTALAANMTAAVALWMPKAVAGSATAQDDHHITYGNKAGGGHERAQQVWRPVGQQDEDEDSRFDVAHALYVKPGVRAADWGLRSMWRNRKSHRAMANQLRGLLKLFGLRLGKVTTPAKRRERLDALFEHKPELKAVMMPLIERLEALGSQV